MDLAWGEGEAVALYNRLKFDPEDPVSSFRIARALFGPDCITRVPLLMAPASTAIVHGRRKIAIRRSVAVEYQGFFVAHEIAHALMFEAGYDGEEDDIERMADFLGACIVCPMPATNALYRRFGRDFCAIADELGCTETLVALRLAEVRHIPRLVVTPKRIHDRLPEDWVHPPESEIRRYIRQPRPGIVKTRLVDAPDRYVIDIEDAG